MVTISIVDAFPIRFPPFRFAFSINSHVGVCVSASLCCCKIMWKMWCGGWPWANQLSVQPQSHQMRSSINPFAVCAVCMLRLANECITFFVIHIEMSKTIANIQWNKLLLLIIFYSTISFCYLNRSIYGCQCDSQWTYEHGAHCEKEFLSFLCQMMNKRYIHLGLSIAIPRMIHLLKMFLLLLLLPQSRTMFMSAPCDNHYLLFIWV